MKFLKKWIMGKSKKSFPVISNRDRELFELFNKAYTLSLNIQREYKNSTCGHELALNKAAITIEQALGIALMPDDLEKIKLGYRFPKDSEYFISKKQLFSEGYRLLLSMHRDLTKFKENEVENG